MILDWKFALDWRDCGFGEHWVDRLLFQCEFGFRQVLSGLTIEIQLKDKIFLSSDFFITRGEGFLNLQTCVRSSCLIVNPWGQTNICRVPLLRSNFFLTNSSLRMWPYEGTSFVQCLNANFIFCKVPKTYLLASPAANANSFKFLMPTNMLMSSVAFLVTLCLLILFLFWDLS